MRDAFGVEPVYAPKQKHEWREAEEGKNNKEFIF
jgi:hypothetical protein